MLKIKLFASVCCLLIVSLNTQEVKPEKKCIRKEFRSLSLNERERFIKAFLMLHKGERPTKLDIFTSGHITYFDYIHTDDRPVIAHEFLPWHRKFLLDLENELLKIDPSVCLTYWKWSEDYYNTMSSIFFQDRYFGSDGNDVTNCTKNGRFKDWTCYYDRDMVINPRCLKREFNGRPNLEIYYNTDTINAIMDSLKDFTSMSTDLEEIHNKFHQHVSGEMISPASSYDPFFWLHHTYIDKLWFDWQLRDPQIRSKDYTTDGSELLHGYNYTAAYFVDFNNMNYSYEDYKSDATRRRDAWIASKLKFNKNQIKNTSRNLRKAPPASLDILKKMHLNVDKFRIFEAKMNSIIEELNQDPNYLPPHFFQ